MKDVKLFAALLVLRASTLLALDPAKAVTQYVHRTWRTDDGLPENVVQAITQTRDGYLWLGTQEGLARFDGVRFVVFDWTNTKGLTSNNVLGLFEDRAGTLWIGTEGGGLATRSAAGVIARPAFLPGKEAHSVRGGFALDRFGAVLAATVDGLVRYASPSAPQPVSPDPYSSVLVARDGSVWVGSYTKGLRRLSGGADVTLDSRSGLPGDAVSSILESKDGSLWVGTRSGLARVRGDRVTDVYRVKDGLSEETIICLLEDRDGSLWIGTEAGGVNRFRGGRFEVYAAPQGLAGESVRALLEDREGNVWIGTEGGGLDVFSDGKVTPIGPPEGLGSERVYTVLATRDGSIWSSLQNGGLDRVSSGRITHELVRGAAGASTGFSLAEARGGGVWLGTDSSGLLCVESGRVTKRYTTKEGLAQNQVFSILEARDGSLWVGTGGMSRLKDGVWKSYGAADGATSNIVYAISEGRDGTLWFGSQKDGLLSWKDGAFRTYGPKEGLSSDTVLGITEGGDGSLWLGTYGGGLARLRGGKLTSFRASNGLPSDLVYIALEEGGVLYASCNKGLFSIAVRDLDRFERREIAAIPVVLFGKADGMRSTECNGGAQYGGARSADGRLFFPTMGGLVVLDPKATRKSLAPPPVAIEEILADDRVVADGRTPAVALEVPPGRGKLEIRYTALALRSRERTRFRVKLEGFDKDFEDEGTRRVATYTNLPPGRYTFRVEATNEDGITSASLASLPITLLPHVWQTRWFLGVWVLLAALAGWGLYALRVRRIKAEFQVILKERSRMAREIHDTLAQGLTGILLQLEAAGNSLGDAEETRGFLDRARRLARGSLSEARRSVWALRSEALEEHDLSGAIEHMARQMLAGRGITVDVVRRGEIAGLPEEAEGELFRIAQEALSNALKYAEPRRVAVEVGSENGRVFVRVTDDGKGFDPENAVSTSGGGFGLRGMKERMARLDGTLVITSRKGWGTTVTAEVPLRSAG